MVERGRERRVPQVTGEVLNVRRRTHSQVLVDDHDVSALRAPRRRRALRGYLGLWCCRIGVAVCDEDGGFLRGGKLIFVCAALCDGNLATKSFNRSKRL